jgi:hypothetical protein
VREVARIIRRSESGTYSWLRAGGLKWLRIEGTIRVLKVDLEQFLAGRSEFGGDIEPTEHGRGGDMRDPRAVMGTYQP